MDWLPVVDFEGYYEVSDLGLVRSVSRRAVCRGGKTRAVPACVLKAIPDKDGYPLVSLSRGEGWQRSYRVHVLVLRAFVGPCPPGQESRHLDGVPEHCWRANLAYGTPVQNWADRKMHAAQRSALCT